MRSRVLVAIFLLLTFTTPVIFGEEVKHTSSTLDTNQDWEGASTPTLTYEGLISIACLQTGLSCFETQD